MRRRTARTGKPHAEVGEDGRGALVVTEGRVWGMPHAESQRARRDMHPQKKLICLLLHSGEFCDIRSGMKAKTILKVGCVDGRSVDAMSVYPPPPRQ